MPSGLNVSGLGWRNDWLWCKRTFGPREAKLEISTNSTFWWWKKQHARGLFSARWWTSWPQQRSAMQSLQYVQSIQAIQILEQSPLCATAKRRRGHLPIPKLEKTAHQHASRKLVSRSRPFWRTQQNVQ